MIADPEQRITLVMSLRCWNSKHRLHHQALRTRPPADSERYMPRLPMMWCLALCCVSGTSGPPRLIHWFQRDECPRSSHRATLDRGRGPTWRTSSVPRAWCYAQVVRSEAKSLQDPADKRTKTVAEERLLGGYKGNHSCTRGEPRKSLQQGWYFHILV